MPLVGTTGLILKSRCRTIHGDREGVRCETTNNRATPCGVACACSIVDGSYAGRIAVRERERADEASKSEAGAGSAEELYDLLLSRLSNTERML